MIPTCTGIPQCDSMSATGTSAKRMQTMMEVINRVRGIGRPQRPAGVRWLAAVAATLPLLGGAAAAEQVEDLRGRTVDVPTPASAISIDDGRFLMALALLHPDPGSLLAAWPKDVHRIGETVYESLVAASPALGSVPRVASS